MATALLPLIHSREGQRVPGVTQAVAFGNKLHVSGDDATLLERTLARFHKPPYEWSRAETGLEEVFIHLMERAEDTVTP